MSERVILHSDTSALPRDARSNVLPLLDIFLRERCQLQLFCRALRDAYDDSWSSFVWGSCPPGWTETPPTAHHLTTSVGSMP